MSAIVLRFLANPNTVNFGGKVHGGTVMKWIDEAGYACATGWAQRYCVTAFIDGIHFHHPIVIGDLVEVEAFLAYTGKTSMNISVEVRSADMKGGSMIKTTECLIVFVSVDSHGRPMSVQPFVPSTPREIAVAEAAKTHLASSRARAVSNVSSVTSTAIRPLPLSSPNASERFHSTPQRPHSPKAGIAWRQSDRLLIAASTNSRPCLAADLRRDRSVGRGLLSASLTNRQSRPSPAIPCGCLRAADGLNR